MIWDRREYSIYREKHICGQQGGNGRQPAMQTPCQGLGVVSCLQPGASVQVVKDRKMAQGEKPAGSAAASDT